MQSCPECGSTKVKVEVGALWRLDCVACGFTQAGTASFTNVLEFEKEARVIFHLETLKQIRMVRAIAPELSPLSTAEIVAAARSSGMKLSVASLARWRAREYVQKAEKAGIAAEIQDDEGKV